MVEIHSLTQEAVPDTIMRGEEQITKQWQSCICSGISPSERRHMGREREREGGKEGEGNYTGQGRCIHVVYLFALACPWV